MKNLQEMGGIAALYLGAAYVVGMVWFIWLGIVMLRSSSSTEVT